MKSKFNFALALFLGLLLSNGAASAQQIQSMKLLTAQTGWAQSGNHLYWTTDGGAHWTDIAPPKSSEENLSGVFFLDASTGWAVLSHANDKGELQFRMASTSDAGATWASSPINLPWERVDQDFAGGAEIFFLDRLHGWINLRIYSSSAFKRGALLATDDGGKTWKAPPGDSGMGGSLCFFSEKDGVLAGGPEDTELWVTHDASKSWQELSLKAPPEAAPAQFPTYDKPICQDAKRGFLPVIFSGADGALSALVLFATNDGGRTWRPDRVLSNLSETSPGEKVPSAVVDSALIAVTWSRGKATLVAAAPSGNVRQTTLLGPAKDASDLSFADPLHGWAMARNGMYSTGDGGASWIDITPPSGHALSPPLVLPQGKPPRPPAAPESSVPPAPLGARRTNPNADFYTEIHLGFDRGMAPTVSQMQTWWNYSPYYDYQVSLPGAANHPVNPNLIPKWVTQVENQGWGLWPVWVGPQATCMFNPHITTVFITAANPTQAYTQGQAQATAAINALVALGLGNIVYYDMENYNRSNTACVNIVIGFLNGWIHALQTAGLKAGVYGNVAPAALDYSQLNPLPDDVWVTLATVLSTPPNVTIWNLASSQVALCDIYSNPQPPSPCPLWSNDQRIHQYIVDGANKITYTETWGRFTDGKLATLEIDADIIDADVAYFSTGTKTYTYNFNTFTPIGNWFNAAYSVNNIGATANYGGFINGSASDAGGEVGQTLMLDESTYPGDGVSGWGYSILDWGTSLDITPPSDTQSLGWCFGTARIYYCTQMLGMNNAGWIAGYWNDWNDLTHGFLNQGGTITSFDAPGAATLGTYATAINDAGLVVGYYYDSNYNTHGFLYNANTQQFIAAPIDYPGGSYTALNGINGDAQMVGSYYDGANYQGFLYSNGTFTGTSGTCGPETVPLGINNNGQMVGNGFVSYDGGLSCSAFDDPAAGGGGTVPYSINDAGQISGTFYSTATSMYDAFIAVPQTP